MRGHDRRCRARRRRHARLRVRGRAPRAPATSSRPERCPAAAAWSSTAGSSRATPSSSRSTASARSRTASERSDEDAARRRIGPRPARPQRLRDPRRGRPGLRAVHSAAAAPYALWARLLPADARRRRSARARTAARLSAFSAGIGVAGGRRPLQGLALVAARRPADARRSRGPARGPAARLQRRALVLAALQRPQPARREPARGAALRPRRPAQLPDPARLGAAPLPLGPRAGASSSRSAGARRCANRERRPRAGRTAPAAALSLTLRQPRRGGGAGAGGAGGRRAAGRPRHRDSRCCRRCSTGSSERGIAATFFVEGLNAELYPDAAARDRRAAATRSPTTPGATSSGAELYARPSRPRTWPGASPPSGGSASRSPACARPAASSAPGGARRPARGGPALLLARGRRGRASRTASPCCRSSGATSTPAACCRRWPRRASR